MEPLDLVGKFEELEDIIESSWNIPFTGVAMVRKKESTELLQKIRAGLPDALNKAKWIMEERQRYLFEGQQEAASIIKEAENRIAAMIDENEITRKAYEQANETIINAQKTAREIKSGSLEYADEILVKMEEALKEAFLEIHKNREEIKKK